MKSDVCRISKDNLDLDALLKEVEKAGAYQNLSEKEINRLRLLSEELVEMMPSLLRFCAGEFWVECEGKKCEIHCTVKPVVTLSSEDREKILAVSSDGKNAAAVGIIGKIRVAAERFLADYDEASKAMPAANLDNMANTMYLDMWTLSAYRTEAKKKKDESWDELEKSIIANIADDVLVGIVAGRVDIIVKKDFTKSN